MPAPRVRGQKSLRNEDIIQDMRIAAAACPRGELSVDRYNRYGRYHSKNAVVRFGSWNAAMRIALPEVYARRHPSPEQMIADLKRVAELCRRQIQKEDDGQLRFRQRTVRQLSKVFYDKHGKYAHTYLITHLATAHLHVDNWTDMKRAIGIDDI